MRESEGGIQGEWGGGADREGGREGVRETKGSLIQSSFVGLRRPTSYSHAMLNYTNRSPLCLSFSGLTFFIGQFIQITQKHVFFCDLLRFLIALSMKCVAVSSCDYLLQQITCMHMFH